MFAAAPRQRTVAAAGRLTAVCFAVRGAIPLLCVRVLHMEPSAGAAAGLALGPALLLLLGFHSVGFMSRSQPAKQTVSLWRSPLTRWLAAYLLFTGASLSWGIAVSPATSAVYWLSLLLDAATVWLLTSLYACAEAAESIFHGYVLGACAIAALAWLMPSQADLRLGDQEFFNTNQIANVCAFGIFFAQYLGRSSRLRAGIPVFMLGVVLLRSLSKTTLVAFLISQGVLLFRDPAISKQTRRRVLLIAAVVLLAASGLLVSYYDVYTNASNQAETLTGRTAIWAWAFERIPDSLWIGHGFDSMWKVIPPFGIDRFEARHAENELLQQMYAYGVAGTLLVIAVYFSLFRAISQAEDKVRPILKALLMFILLRGLAEAEPFDLLLPVWTLLLLAAVTMRAAL